MLPGGVPLSQRMTYLDFFRGAAVLLVLTTALEYRHDSITDCQRMLSDLGETPDDQLPAGAKPGSRFTTQVATDDLADFTAAAHLSVIDYLGALDWRGHQQTKDWYAVMKSRPSFRPLLSERMEVIMPPAHYDKPDF